MGKGQRNDSEISLCVKYMLFGFNVFFWLIGGGLIAIGLWAWSDKGTLTNLVNTVNIALDPVLFFIIVGVIIFALGFAGCVGALRENICLLRFYSVIISIFFLAELVAGILAFVFKDTVEDYLNKEFLNIVKNYREDPDLQNIVDWMQETFQCCGGTGYDDWDFNVYFNCSTYNKDIRGSREACGVPYSCCKNEADEVVLNSQCGYDVRDPNYEGNPNDVIYTDGCVTSLKSWMEKNIYAIAGVLLAIAVIQISGVGFANRLISDIKAQKARWRRNLHPK